MLTPSLTSPRLDNSQMLAEKRQAPQCFTGFKARSSTQLTDGLR